MIPYRSYRLENGLQVILHEDSSTPLVAVNLLYDVGSKDEHPDKTGFAHLFEHLMFGGSENAPSYDDPIQEAGGENNAFTNCDITNFFSVLPAHNMETALWLESDRMQHLILNEEALGLEQKIVIEEFKETCLNQPFGDVWHYLYDLAYEQHAYNWPTIGKSLTHIEGFNVADARAFYQSYYGPNNAILTIAGNLPADIEKLIEKWFGGIPVRNRPVRQIPVEKVQSEKRLREHQSNVPLDALYMAFHMPGRTDSSYYACDFLSDVLSNGKSSRLYQRILKEQKLCSYIDAYITGTSDPGLLIIEAKAAQNVELATIEKAIWEEIGMVRKDEIPKKELQKLKNKIDSSIAFSNVHILNKAMNLAYYQLIGNPELINAEISKYQKIQSADIKDAANTILQPENSNILYYRKRSAN